MEAESGTLAGGDGGLNVCVALEAVRRMASSGWGSVGAGARWLVGQQVGAESALRLLREGDRWSSIQLC